MSFTFLSNRNESLFRAALLPVGGLPWHPGIAAVDLLYFDHYGGKQTPAGLRSYYSLMDRENTIPLDHKLKLAKTLVANGLNTPRYYFHPDEVPDEPETFWYVKDPLSSAGRKICLSRKPQLEGYFKPGYVIQEAINDIALLGAHKFTLRTYVLVCNRLVYWYPESFLVVHGKPFLAEEADPLAHYSHQGYMDPASNIRLVASQHYRANFRLEMPIVELIQDVFSLFEPQLGKNNPAGRYCIFGLDLLQRTDGSMVLIEINDRPNFHHTDEINKLVNQPMLQALSTLLLADKVNSHSAKHFEEVMFFN